MSGPSIDGDLVDRVRAALAGVADVHEKRMFGSVGFMVRGNLCVTARPARLMCRIGSEKHEKAVECEGCETVVMKGRPCLGYVYVDSAAVATDAALTYWIGLCLEHNVSLAVGEGKKAGPRAVKVRSATI